MPLWKLTLSYDGGPFHGWQIQPGLPTVQGTLADALRRITGESVLPQGSGRTDTGVHALAQVASFPLSVPIPPANLHRALNRILPASIRVLTAEPVSPPFHARHSAMRKTYEYRIFPSHVPRSAVSAFAAEPDPVICPPFLAPWVWDCHLSLSLEALNEAARHVVGTHDFTSFAATAVPQAPATPAEALPDYPATPPTPVRTIFASAWQRSSDLLVYRVVGSGFLHHMVRNLVGTFVEAGSGRISPAVIPSILAAQNRSAAGATAPARGLFLVSVEYPPSSPHPFSGYTQPE
jgi:tRNA pseudouridine38-40 synthase